jgi:hypothetical protein
LQAPHNFDGRVIGIADSENDLQLRIVLLTVTAKTLPHFRVDAAERFENGHWRELGFWQRSLSELFVPIAEKAGHPDRRQKIKNKAPKSSNCADSFNHSPGDQ